MSTRVSAPGGRFPRAWLQPPRRFAPAGSSAHAIPAGVATLRFNQENCLLINNNSLKINIKQFFNSVNTENGLGQQTGQLKAINSIRKATKSAREQPILKITISHKVRRL